MKKSYKKTGFLFLLLWIGSIAMAQSLVDKTLLEDLNTLQNQLVPDKRVAVLNINIEEKPQVGVVISGETDLPEAKEKIVQLLKDKKIRFIDSIRMLPDTAVGATRWALVKLSVSNMRSQPDHASELVSQALMGTPMKVLDVKDGWYRVQTPDSYIGWMDAGGVQLITPKELNSWKGANRCLFNRMQGYMLASPRKKGEIVSDLVLGDLFEVERQTKGFLKIKTPDGRSGYVRKRECKSWSNWSNQQPDIESILTVAHQMMGTPYLWGGSSAKAADCSGFVKLAYYSQAIILSRDASQQARYGEKIDFSKQENLQAGDLLFFGRSAEHISHVGIYIKEGDFIHTSGRVHISSIDPRDEKYSAIRKTVGSCRIVNSLNSEGIVRVKDHPWYRSEPIQPTE